jgi:hydrogenase maturation protein HypF
MYKINRSELLVVHDSHPQYVSTIHAAEFADSQQCSVQHHRAHIASVIAERGAWDKRVVGVSFDGTGYGDDGTIWGGEFFAGSVREGFERVAHLRNAFLAGGDGAAVNPVQAAAGFLTQLDELPDLMAAPFSFPQRYLDAKKLLDAKVRSFQTSSAGRLFDTAAALLGFTRDITFEGQAAMWLEQLARRSGPTEAYPFPFVDSELDFRPLLQSIIRDRLRGKELREIARAFQSGIAEGLCTSIVALCRNYTVDAVVLSGGVFQNELLLHDVKSLLENQCLQIWTNGLVPANDGGISLGQAALAACAIAETTQRAGSRVAASSAI